MTCTGRSEDACASGVSAACRASEPSAPVSGPGFGAGAPAIGEPLHSTILLRRLWKLGHTKHCTKCTWPCRTGHSTYSDFMVLSIFGLTPVILSLLLFIIPASRSASLVEASNLIGLSRLSTFTSYLYSSSSVMS